jgi:DNA replication initiation complex subunit (GINS family)
MKRIWLVLVLSSLVLAACGSGGSAVPAETSQTLVVTDGTKEVTYRVADLEKLGGSEATFNEVTYEGVALPALLADAGFEVGTLKGVKAVAADGYSVNYEPALFQRTDVLVAYATVDGALGEEDGVFRMVLPGEEGKLNVRMLAELRVTP